MLPHLVEFPLIAALHKWFISDSMTINFNFPTVEILSTSEVLKSEDGQIYSFLFSGGSYSDSDLCIPSNAEDANYYFYSGDCQISMVEVKNPT
jgi:hypothetical protein